MNRQPRMTHKAESYFDHNARRHGDVSLDVVEFTDESAIVVDERRITREEFDALLLEAIRRNA